MDDAALPGALVICDINILWSNELLKEFLSIRLRYKLLVHVSCAYNHLCLGKVQVVPAANFCPTQCQPTFSDGRGARS